MASAGRAVKARPSARLPLRGRTTTIWIAGITRCPVRDQGCAWGRGIQLGQLESHECQRVRSRRSASTSSMTTRSSTGPGEGSARSRCRRSGRARARRQARRDGRHPPGAGDRAGGRLACVSIEGEPGIGKTRLLMAAQELAEAEGFVPIAVWPRTRSCAGRSCWPARSSAAGRSRRSRPGRPTAESAVQRAIDVLSGRDDPALGGLPPRRSSCAPTTWPRSPSPSWRPSDPLAILLDDLQWADEDSLRLLRYVVRSDADRPDPHPHHRPTRGDGRRRRARHAARRHGPPRPSCAGSAFIASRPTETAELLRLVLGGEVEPTSAATIHGQAEGVPFIVEELAKAYREAGIIRPVDGTWTLSPNAASSCRPRVRTLIGRRAARLPDDTKALLADAGVLGRSFSLRDLRAIRSGWTGRSDEDVDLAELVRAGDRGRAPGPLSRRVARRLRVPPRAGPRVRRRRAVRRAGAGRSTRSSSSCSPATASRRRRACRCSPTTPVRPATPRRAPGSRSRPPARRSGATLRRRSCARSSSACRSSRTPATA